MKPSTYLERRSKPNALFLVQRTNEILNHYPSSSSSSLLHIFDLRGGGDVRNNNSLDISSEEEDQDDPSLLISSRLILSSIFSVLYKVIQSVYQFCLDLLSASTAAVNTTSDSHDRKEMADVNRNERNVKQKISNAMKQLDKQHHSATPAKATKKKKRRKTQMSSTSQSMATNQPTKLTATTTTTTALKTKPISLSTTTTTTRRKSKTPPVHSNMHLKTTLKSTNPNYRIQQELKNFLLDPPDHLSVQVGKNIRVWMVKMEGVGIYQGETFYLRISFPPKYPMVPPSVYFWGKMIPMHEHVYTNGDICLSLLGKDWRPTMTAQSIAHSILSILGSASHKSLPMDNAKHATNEPGQYQQDWVYHDDLC